MKRKTTFRMSLIAFFLIAGGFFLLQRHSQQQSQLPPQPIDVVEEEGEIDRLREAYMDEIHRAAPEVNWRSRDEQFRVRKAKERFERYRSGVRTSGGKESLANGQLTGSWREVGSNNLAGRTIWADFDTISRKLYVVSASGNIWRASLDGSNWEVMNDNFHVDQLLMVKVLPGPNGPRIVAACPKWGNIHFIYSDDDGATWNWSQGLATWDSWGQLERAVVSNNLIYLIGLEWNYTDWHSMVVVYRSTDLGTSFSPVDTFHSEYSAWASNYELWTDEYAPNAGIFVLEGNRVYKLDANDQFQHLATLPSSFPTTNAGTLRLTGRETPNGTYLYAYFKDPDPAALYRSTDGGLNWTYMSSPSERLFHENSLNCSQANPDHVFIGGVNCLRSYDGGASWQTVNNWWEYYGDSVNKLHADICGINPVKDPQANDFIVLNTDGGTYLSYDELQTVQNISLSGLNVSQYYSVMTNRTNTDVIYAGSQDQGFQRSLVENNSIRDFTQVISGDYGHLSSSDQGQTIWSVYPSFLMYYPFSDISTNLIPAYYSSLGLSQMQFLNPLMEDPDHAQKVYMAGGNMNGDNSSHIIHVSYDNGPFSVNQLPFDFSKGGSSRLSALAFSGLNSQFRYAASSTGNFYRSADGGNSWTEAIGFNGPAPHYFYGNDILPSPTQLGRVYVCGSGYSNPGVYVSQDHGQTFSPMNNGLPATMIFQLAATTDESMLFAATEVGPYVYIPADDQWYNMEGMSGPDNRYWSVEWVEELKVARFATYGRGIFDFEVDVPVPGLEFTLIDAVQNTEIGPISDGDVLDLTYQPTERLNIRWDGAPQGIGSALFGLNSNPNFKVDNNPPFALAGNTTNPPYSYFQWTPSPGLYTLTATAYTGSSAQGTAVFTQSISFTVIRSVESITGFSLVDAKNNVVLGPLQEGDQIDLANIGTHKLNIIAHTAPEDIGSVDFDLRGDAIFDQFDNQPPYCMARDNQNGGYYQFLFGPGNYNLTATPYSAFMAGGIAGNPMTINFTVVNSGARMAMPTETFSVYPNPSSGKLNLEFLNVQGGMAQLQIYDLRGSLLRNQRVEVPPGSSTQAMRIYDLATGVYMLQCRVGEEVFTTRIIKN